MRDPPFTLFAFILSLATVPIAAWSDDTSLWDIYANTLKQAKYIDLTHAFTPTIPVWLGFGHAAFKPAVAGEAIAGYVEKGQEFTYAQHGFVATAYDLPTDQYGTQLDPPAHWNEWGATISDLPATYAIRPLVVIDVHDKVAADPGYHATVEDIEAWENEHGRIPEGSVVMIRSDWSKTWDDAERFTKKPFPGVRLDTLKFLHLERKILFHGHEPLDTDTTATLEGEAWLMHNHFAQAEGVANLDQVPGAGALIVIGFAKPLGGTGGYARYVAIAPKDWPFGVSMEDAPGAPLPRQPYPLKRDGNGVLAPARP
jgi:kynurenine formamidase